MPKFVADAHLASMSQRAGEVLRKRRLAALPSGQLAPMPGLQHNAQKLARRAALGGAVAPVVGTPPQAAAAFHHRGYLRY